MAKLHNKLGALDKLAKRLGMYAADTVEHRLEVTETDEPSTFETARRIGMALELAKRKLDESKRRCNRLRPLPWP